MPEQEPPNETPESVETPPGSETAPDGNETADSGQNEESVPPEVLRKKLTEANAEAANYRTKLREAEAKLSQAKTVEEFEAATTELRTQNAALERRLLLNGVAAKFELPPALAQRLNGNTEAELEADAKELQKLVVAPTPQSLAGGLDPDDGEDDFDPVEAARAARKRRY